MAARPAGVTVVSIIVWIQGFLTALGGALAILTAPAQGANAGGFYTVGIISLIIGLITIAVAFGLWRGSNGARILTTVILIISGANAVFAIFATGSIAGQIGSLVLAVIALILLYTSRANDYFRTT